MTAIPSEFKLLVTMVTLTVPLLYLHIITDMRYDRLKKAINTLTTLLVAVGIYGLCKATYIIWTL